MRYVYSVFWLILIVLAITFTALNAHTVLINYYLGTRLIFLPLLLLIFFVVGIILGAFAVWIGSLKLRKAVRSLRQQLKDIAK